MRKIGDPSYETGHYVSDRYMTKADLAQYIANLYVVRDYLQKVWPDRIIQREIIDKELESHVNELTQRLEHSPEQR